MTDAEKYKYPLPSGKRYKIYLRDKFTCLKCLCDDPSKLTLDHIVPVSEGGSDALTNLQTLCKKCNGLKANSTIDYRSLGCKYSNGHIQTVIRYPFVGLHPAYKPHLKEYEDQDHYNETREIKSIWFGGDAEGLFKLKVNYATSKNTP